MSAGYFEAMGTRLVRGRYFAASDSARTLPVAIVDERLASRLWPNEDPIGKVVFRGTHSKQTVDGKLVPLTRGRIQLQSEGAEVFYRNIEVGPLD